MTTQGREPMPPKGYTKPDELKKKRHRETPASFYFGDPELRQTRLDNLDRIAEDLQVENRSKLIQMIADGQVTLKIKKAKPSPN